MFSNSHLLEKQADRDMIAAAMAEFYARGNAEQVLQHGETAEPDDKRRSRQFVLDPVKHEQNTASKRRPRKEIEAHTATPRRLTFDRFTENLDTGMEYRGMKAEPSYERFRKDMTILAGYYDATYDINGKVRVEAKSWSFGNMDEEEREKMYSALINVALRKFFGAQLTEAKLREIVEQILGFAS